MTHTLHCKDAPAFHVSTPLRSMHSPKDHKTSLRSRTKHPVLISNSKRTLHQLTTVHSDTLATTVSKSDVLIQQPYLQRSITKKEVAGATDFAAGFVSVREMPTEMSLQVDGQLPSYLQGNLYRIGPGIFDLYHSDGQRAEKNHWFDGIGVVFKFNMDARNNAITFMNRTICPEAVRAIEATPKAEYKELSFGATGPKNPSFFDKIKTLFRPFTRDPATGKVPMNLNVTLEKIPGQGDLVARSDFSHNIVLDPDTLLPTHRFDFSKINPDLSGVAAAAHSMTDEATGEVFNFSAGDWRNFGRYRVFRIKPTGEAEVLAEIQGNPACHVHSISLTPNYVIIAISPWRVDVKNMFIESALAPNLHFDEDKNTTFYVISRTQKMVVAQYKCKAFCAFHYVNAFEDVSEDALHIDVCRYDKGNILEQFYLENLRTRSASWFSPVKPVRYSLRGVFAAASSETVYKGRAESRPMSTIRLELPCVAPGWEGKPYRYAYGVSHDKTHDDILANCLVKVDMYTGHAIRWKSERCCVGEPTFVANPIGELEDDGMLVTVVVDATKKTSFIVVLDARTLKEVCRAKTPQTVPHAFHGLYIGESERTQLSESW